MHIHTLSSIYLFSPLISPPLLILWAEGGSNCVENGSMSVFSHVQTEVSCGQPCFMNANKKGDRKSYQNTTDN